MITSTILNTNWFGCRFYIVYFILYYSINYTIQLYFTSLLYIYLEYYYSYLLTPALLANLARSERKDVKGSVRIDEEKMEEK